MMAEPQVTQVAERLTDGLKSMPCVRYTCRVMSEPLRSVWSQNEQVWVLIVP